MVGAKIRVFIETAKKKPGIDICFVKDGQLTIT